MPGETERQVIFPDDILTAVTLQEATALAQLARDQEVLELGAFHGYSTVVLASVANRVISVDWHEGDEQAGLGNTWDIFCGNLERYSVADRVTAIRGRFEDEVPELAAAGVRVDGCFIDGQHDKASVQRDLDLAKSLVRPGGWIASHDYGRCAETGNPGFEVTEVMDRFGVEGVAGTLAWGIAGV